MPVALAHQPRMVDEQFTVIEDPEISKAFYGELTGTPHVYMFSSDRPFRLFVSLLVPDEKEAEFDFSAAITRTNGGHEEIVAVSHGLDSEWSYFYEPFAKDGYWNMDVFGEDHSGIYMSPGVYEIRVFSPDNEGKYVLATGDVEYFPFKEMLNTWIVLPRVKQYMGKNPLTAYTNMVGGPFLVFLLLLGYAVYRLAKK